MGMRLKRDDNKNYTIVAHNFKLFSLTNFSLHLDHLGVMVLFPSTSFKMLDWGGA
jgi:hypothetical protein